MIVDLATFTTIHVALSLVALASGIIVVIGLIGSKPLPMWNALFLATGFATSATGFGFPFTAFLPSHGVAMVALVVLALTMLAYYGFGRSGAWRPIYVVGVVVSLYFNVFVAIVQAFKHIPLLAALAPTGSEPPFAAAQGVALVIFVVLAVWAAVRFHPGALMPSGH
jgi:hypothetical protein